MSVSTSSFSMTPGAPKRKSSMAAKTSSLSIIPLLFASYLSSRVSPASAPTIMVGIEYSMAMSVPAASMYVAITRR